MSDAPKRVLIVDDDPEITDVLTDYFKGKTGFTIETAATAEAGVAAARRVRPDLVLLDLEMPGLGGMEGLKQLRRTIGEVPVLIVTWSYSNAPFAIAWGARLYPQAVQLPVHRSSGRARVGPEILTAIPSPRARAYPRVPGAAGRPRAWSDRLGRRPPANAPRAPASHRR